MSAVNVREYQSVMALCREITENILDMVLKGSGGKLVL